MRSLRGFLLLVVSSSVCALIQTPKTEFPPKISVEELVVSGTTNISQADLDQIKQAVREYPFATEGLSKQLRDRIRDEFQQRGYFRAVVSEPEITWERARSAIRVSVATTDGDQYRLQRLELVPPPKCTSEEVAKRRSCKIEGTCPVPVCTDKLDGLSLETLRSLFPITDGDIMNIEKIREGLSSLRVAFGNRGYINFTPTPRTDVNEQNKEIVVVIDFDPGPQFQFGEIKVTGASSEETRAIEETLKALRNKPYQWSLLGKLGEPRVNLECLLEITKREQDENFLVDISVDLSPQRMAACRD